MLLKKNICFFCLFFLPVLLFAQLPTDTLMPADSLLSADTLQSADTLLRPTLTPVHVATAAEKYDSLMLQVFNNNKLLNSKATPVTAAVGEKAVTGMDIVFYSLLFTALLLAFLRFFYSRYFNSLFQVFFNTSLRQSQLTDQLLQAKLASGLFNLFFVITGGIYIFLLLWYYSSGDVQVNYLLMIVICIVVLAAVYLIKYVALKFTGWLTGFKEVANTYLFVIFLINKIISVLLLPFVVVIAFAMPGLKLTAIILSFLLVGSMFFLRFIRSFGLLKNKIKVSWFHFLVFIIGVEVLPLLLIYRGVVILLPKNL